MESWWRRGIQGFTREAGLRFLARRKAAATAAILTMALALGANTAAFSVLRAFLLSSLAVPDADRVVLVGPMRELPGRGTVLFADAWPNYQLLQETQQVFAGLTATVPATVGWDAGEEVRPLQASRVTASFFPTMRVPSALGRTFHADEEGPNPALVVVVSHAFWQGALAGNPSAVGSVLRLDGEPYTVIGVMPEGFVQPVQSGPTEIWLPFDIPVAARTAITGGRLLTTYARLADGVAPAAADASIRDFTRRTAEANRAANGEYAYQLQTLRQSLLTGADATVVMVQLGALVLLLLAVLNVASLLIAWGFERRQELTVRLALGGRGGTVVRLLVLQALVVVGAGALLGLGLARVALWGVGQVDLGPALGFFLSKLEMDGGVLLLTGGVTIAAGVLAGLVPVWFTGGADLATALRPGSRSLSLSPGAVRWQKGMVVAQVALSVVILAAAALMARSFHHLAAIPDGFASEGLVVARVQLPEPGYASHPRRAGFATLLLDQLAQQPELAAAGFSSTLPVSDVRWGNRFLLERAEGGLEDEPTLVHIRRVSPGYLTVMGIPVLQGRGIEPQDDSTGRLVAVVSRSLALRITPDGNAVGRRIYRPGTATTPPEPVEVVGVVGDVMDGGYAAPPGEAVYVPWAQLSATRLSIVVRSRTTPDAAIGAIRRGLRATDPVLAATNPAGLESLVLQANALPRLRAMVLLAFGLVGLGIVTLGSYGVMSQLVSTREREFLIRLAHGAVAENLGRTVLGQVGRLTLPGVVIGGIVAWLAGESVRPFVYGIEPRSLAILVGVGAVTVVVALVATLPSARRAMRLEVHRIQSAS